MMECVGIWDIRVWIDHLHGAVFVYAIGFMPSKIEKCRYGAK